MLGLFVDYEVSVLKDEGIVRVDVIEPATAAIQKSFTKDAIVTAQGKDLTRFLIDVSNVPNLADTFDMYELAYEQQASTPLTPLARFAILVGEGDRSYDFMETLLLNAGFKSALFHDQDAALSWLTV